jgi:hypothetical protein
LFSAEGVFAAIAIFNLPRAADKALLFKSQATGANRAAAVPPDGGLTAGALFVFGVVVAHNSTPMVALFLVSIV